MSKPSKKAVKTALILAFAIISANLLGIAFYNTYIKQNTIDNNHLGISNEISLDHENSGSSSEQMPSGTGDNSENNQNSTESDLTDKELANLYNDDRPYPSEGDMGDIDKLAIHGKSGIVESIETDKIRFTLGDTDNGLTCAAFNPKIEPIDSSVTDDKFVITFTGNMNGIVLPQYESTYDELEASGEKVLLSLSDGLPYYYRTSTNETTDNTGYFGFDAGWSDNKEPVDFIMNITGYDSGKFYGSFDVKFVYSDSMNGYKLSVIEKNETEFTEEKQVGIDEQVDKFINSEKLFFNIYEFEDTKQEFIVDQPFYDNMTALDGYGYILDSDISDSSKPYTCVVLNTKEDTGFCIVLYFSNEDLRLLGYKQIMMM